MTASIIILTYNQLELTKQCFQTIKENTALDYEVIVVDNCSTDGTVDYLISELPNLFFNYRYILNDDNKGFAIGVNQGISVATGEYICLLNNDTEVTKDWLSKMILALESYENAMVVGPVSNGTFPPQYVSAPEYVVELVKEVNILYGFCILFSRELIRNIGMLDEQYKVGNFEDHDFHERVIKIGGKLVIDCSTYIYHHCHKSWKSKLHLDYTTVINQKRFENKWGFSKKIEKEIGTYKYFGCKKSLIVILSDSMKKNCDKISDLKKNMSFDEVIFVDSHSNQKVKECIEDMGKLKRVIHVKVPSSYVENDDMLIHIGLNNIFGEDYQVIMV